MKKTILAILLTLACALSLFAFTGCDPMHVPVVDPAKDATCTEPGLTQGAHCEICGEVLEKQFHTQPTGHIYSEDTNACIYCGVVTTTPSFYFNFKKLEDGTYEISCKNPSDMPKCVVIPEFYGETRITSISDTCFSNCKNLVRVVLPASINNIGNFALGGCLKLEEIIVHKDNAHYTTVDGVLYSKLQTTLLQYPAAKESDSFAIPATVIRISDGAFYGSKVKAIDFGTALVESIGYSAFSHSDLLTSIVIPDSVVSIGNLAFQHCDSLASVEFGESVSSIGFNAFVDCRALKTVHIPASVRNISTDAFHGCTALTSFDVAELNPSYTAIDGNLFDKSGTTLIQCATADTNSLILPKSLALISSGAFSSCAKNAVIYYEGSASDWDKILVGRDNDTLETAAIYYYSEEEPEASDKFWHYVDGAVVVWKIAE